MLGLLPLEYGEATILLEGKCLRNKQGVKLLCRTGTF